MTRWVCGCPEQLGDGSAMHKGVAHVKVFFRRTPPGIDPARFKAAVLDGFNRWSALADVSAVETSDEAGADWIVQTQALSPGVLANMMLPNPHLRQQEMNFSTRVAWRLDDLFTHGQFSVAVVSCHEGGHGWGLLHFARGLPEEIMEPEADPNVTKPQPTEGAIMRKLYGPPKITGGGDGSGDGDGGSCDEVAVTVTVRGRNVVVSTS